MNNVHHASHPDNATHCDLAFLDAVGYQPSPEDLAAVAAPWVLTEMADFVADQASFLRSQDTDLEHWLADKLDLLVSRIRFLGAATPEQFEDRERTLLRDQLTVRPSARTVPAGRYRAWDVLDGLGVEHHCTDLWDAMMLIQSRHPA